MHIILTIAGSDTSAGAGIQQDLKTITAHGDYAATVITALTSQNTIGVQDVMPVPKDVVGSQLVSVFSDLDVRAIKIGQIPNAETAECISSCISEYFSDKGGKIPVVYDPVMISTSGRRLMSADSISTIKEKIFPLCTLITPNIPEAEHLSGITISSEEDIRQAGIQLASLYGVNILIKGGHAEGTKMTDRLFSPQGVIEEFLSDKIESSNLHGTGCTLSSAIACHLSNGDTLSQAISKAKDFVSQAIAGGKDLCIGRGNGPLWNF